MKKSMRTNKPQVLTANRLDDGAVVYRTAGRWSPRFDEAQVFEAEAAETALTAAAEDVANQLIVGPYLFAIEAVEGAIRPISVRENIRAKGPTVRTDLGKQAEPGLAPSYAPSPAA